MWLNSTNSICAKLNPENYDWHLDDFLRPTRFIGDQTPLKIQDIVEIKENQDQEESNESNEFENQNYSE